MSLTQNSALKLDFLAKDLAPQLDPLCRRVLAEFRLPPLRLYCYFAETDDPYLRRKNGKYYRGFHISIEGRSELPEYLSDCFFHPFNPFGNEEVTWENTVSFDNLIYVAPRTCLDPTACVLTFAHELQHFMQYGYSKKVWAVNCILYNHIVRFDPFTPRTTIDIPHERDANIVSKRIAEEICGIEAIRIFAEEQVKEFEALARSGDEVAASEKVRWEFFRDVPSSTTFNMLAETISLVDKFKPQLIAERFGVSESIDFSQREWWQ
jgi:hypothetical protein